MRETYAKTVKSSDVVGFAEITGDRNPIHLSEHFAAKTPFKNRIAHGLYTASLISAVIGTRLPGPGAIYISQTLNFLSPVKIGDTVEATVEIIELDPRAPARPPVMHLHGRRCHGSQGRGLGQGSAPRMSMDGRAKPMTALRHCCDDARFSARRVDSSLSLPRAWRQAGHCARVIRRIDRRFLGSISHGFPCGPERVRKDGNGSYCASVVSLRGRRAVSRRSPRWRGRSPRSAPCR